MRIRDFLLVTIIFTYAKRLYFFRPSFFCWDIFLVNNKYSEELCTLTCKNFDVSELDFLYAEHEIIECSVEKLIFLILVIYVVNFNYCV